MSTTNPTPDDITETPAQTSQSEGSKVQSDESESSTLLKSEQLDESFENPAQSTHSEPSVHFKSDQSEKPTQEGSRSIQPIKEEKTEKHRPSHLEVSRVHRKSEVVVKKQKKLSDLCFIGLFWAVVLVKLWMNAWLLQLLPILIVFILLKKLGKYS